MEYSRPVLYCDCENTLDAEWARKLGVDTDSLIVLNPTSQCAEDIFEFVLQMVETGEIGLFVIDSLGVMVSKEAMEKTIDQKTYAGISRPLTAFSNKVEMAMQKHQVTGICINQVRENLNSSWGGLTTPGGKAFKHVCSVRMQFSKGKYIDERGNELTRSAESPAGNIVLMSMEKNKTCPPTRRTGQYTLNYSIGIDYLKDLVDVAIKYEIIDKKGAWFSIIDIETGEVIANNIQGQANVNEYLEAHDEVLKRVEELIDSKILI
jgi:recombination protein RecA